MEKNTTSEKPMLHAPKASATNTGAILSSVYAPPATAVKISGVAGKPLLRIASAVAFLLEKNSKK